MSIVVKVIQDEDAQSPRAEDCNFGVMACWHRRHHLGDVQPNETPEEWLKENAPKGSVVLPLYLYDHSGLTMSTGSFGDRWDSGRVGYIVATPEAIRKNFMKKRITAEMRTKAEEVLKGEVEAYNDYLNGNVWGYTIERIDECSQCHQDVHKHEDDDSCWGFYGSDKGALEAMKEHVAEEHHKALEAAWDKRFG